MKNTGKITKSSITDRFTTLPNEFLRNQNLSFKAKGLLCTILSFPPDWKIYKSNLHEYATDGVDSVRTAWNELQAAGYIKATRLFNEDNTFAGWDYEVCDEPRFLCNTVSDSPILDFPISDFPITGNPLTENPTITNNDITNNDLIKDKRVREKKSAADKNEKKAPPVPPPPPPPGSIPVKKVGIRETAVTQSKDDSLDRKTRNDFIRFVRLIDSDFPVIWTSVGRFISPTELQSLKTAGFEEERWKSVMVDICGAGLLPQHNLYYRIQQFIKNAKTLTPNASNSRFVAASTWGPRPGTPS